MARRAVGILVLALLATLTSAFLQCEDLRPNECAFAVASSGARCTLETYPGINGEVMHECQTSMVMAEAKEEYIETSECISACGVERMTVGLSTDILMEKKFMESLCSPDCVEQCPNIFDLYLKLAAGEGLYLPQICKSQLVKTRDQYAGRKEATNMKVMENSKAIEKLFEKPRPIWKNIWKEIQQQAAQINPPASTPTHWWNRGHKIWDNIPPTQSPPNITPRSWSSSPMSPEYLPATEAPSSSRDFNYGPHTSPQPWSPYPSPFESTSSSSSYQPLSPSPSSGMPSILPPSPASFLEPAIPSQSPSQLPSPSESPLPIESLAPSPLYEAPSLSPQFEFPIPASFSPPAPPPFTFQAPSPPPQFIPNPEAPIPAVAFHNGVPSPAFFLPPE